MNSRTFVMLKPDAIQRNLLYDCTCYFKRYGLSIDVADLVTPTADMVTTHYRAVIKKYGNDFANKMCDYMVGRTVMPMILSTSRGDAIQIARAMIGATEPVKAEAGTIRGDFSEDSFELAASQNRTCYNLIHSSDSRDGFVSEVKIWLPKYDLGR